MTRATDNFETVLRAMRVFNGFEGPTNEDIWWRTDEEYAPVTLFANCNDLFFWGCADCEEINDENIHVLEKAYADLCAIGDHGNRAHLLFVCRERGMRPQGAYYKYIDGAIRHLFDECGPERETGIGNPMSQEKVAQEQAP